MLFKKILRTFLSYKAQFISMIVMVFLGVGIFSGFNAEWYSIEKNINYFFDESNLADYRIYITNEMKNSLTGFSDDDLNKVLNINGVEEASKVVEINTTETKENDTIKLCVSTNTNVTKPVVIKGNEYDSNSSNGIWISENYAERNNYNIGDEITLSYGKMFNYTFKIEGIALSGEYLINTDGIAMMPNFDTIGYSFISPLAYKEALGFDFYTQINIKSNLELDNLSNLIDETLENNFQILSKDDLASYSEAYGESDEGKTMGLLLPVIFLLIAILTMVTTMNRLTQNEKIQIGILKALGFKDKKIIWHYTSYALFVGIVGSILGIGLGYGVGYFVFSKNGSMGTYFEMPCWNLYMPWFVWVGIIGIILFLTFIGYLSVRKILNGTAADALRPFEPKKMKALKIEKTKAFHKLGFDVRWNLRDIFCYPARTFMTIFGIFGCTLLLFATFGMLSTMNAFINSYYNTSLNYETKLSLSEEITNDKALELVNLYSGDYSTTIAIKIKGKTYTLDIFNNSNDKYVLLDNDSKKMLNVDNNGCYICQRVAEEFNIKKGDILEFSLYGNKKTFKVAVIDTIYSLSEGIVMTTKAADEINVPYTINAIYTDTLKDDILDSEYITSVYTKNDIMETFDSFTKILNEMIALLVAFSCILAFVVLYNLGTISFIERYRELSTLKVLGFKNKKIRILILSQTIWLTIIGIVIGVPCGMLILKLLIKLLASDYEMKIYYAPYVYIISILLTFVVSALVSFLVSRKIKNINMVEALKSE